MTSGIYEIRNSKSVNRYVGSSVDLRRREWDHFDSLRKGQHRNAHLQNAFNKYGENAFSFHIILECFPEELLRQEQEQIDSYDFRDLYNIQPTAGSPLGMTRSDEAKAKMSAGHMGYVHSEETKVKMSVAHSNPSDEARSKMSAAHMGVAKGPPSDEHRAKISAALMGMTFTEERRANMRGKQNALGSVRSDETRAKMSKSAKAWWQNKK